VAQLRRLQARFRGELVVLGVHSAKFPSERLTANIREAILRHGIEHPVVNDAGFEVWGQYAVRAWPTVVAIDPEGYAIGSQSGEIDAERFAEYFEARIAEYRARGALDTRALATRREAELEPDRTLRFPTRLIVTSEASLFVADTGHHRILELELASDHRSARIVRTFGSGIAGLVNGPSDQARFSAPHGITRSGSTLYVADTGNHAVRAIDLASGDVRTIAGTGHKATLRPRPGDKPTETALRSPWAVAMQRPRLFVAVAGSHQIFTLEDERELRLFAGTGREALVDGAALEASFNQPSDLAAAPDELYVADAEASAIRRIPTATRPVVETLVGAGLFEFGDRDGIAENVRLQHPTGIAWADGQVWIADTYNNKIKRLDPETRRCVTIIGSGTAGHADGAIRTATLFEPEGVAVRGRRIYVADTNNHAIRVADLDKLKIHTLEIT
jgi:sugar lactone lactonase YvrE